MNEYTQSVEEILAQTKSTENGLSSAEAAKRLEEHGPNRLKAAAKPPLLQRFLDHL